MPDSPHYSRMDFLRFFWRRYALLLRAAFDPAQRNPDFHDPAVARGLADDYAGLARPAPDPDMLPRHIFMLWQQGWDKAPPIVRASAESWKRHNPGWELHLLDDRSLSGIVPDLDFGRVPAGLRTARANLARLALLEAHGGVWADATLFCTRPLSDWLPSRMEAGLFLFSRPRPYRLFDIWFMAAVPGNPALRAWGDIVRAYWRLFSRPYHYYWMEYLYEMLVERDPDVRSASASIPKLSALGPLAVGYLPFERNAPRELFDLIEAAQVPVFKLSHKWRFEGPLAGTPVGELTGLEQL